MLGGWGPNHLRFLVAVSIWISKAVGNSWLPNILSRSPFSNISTSSHNERDKGGQDYRGWSLSKKSRKCRHLMQTSGIFWVEGKCRKMPRFSLKTHWFSQPSSVNLSLGEWVLKSLIIRPDLWTIQSWMKQNRKIRYNLTTYPKETSHQVFHDKIITFIRKVT